MLTIHKTVDGIYSYPLNIIIVTNFKIIIVANGNQFVQMKIMLLYETDQGL